VCLPASKHGNFNGAPLENYETADHTCFSLVLSQYGGGIYVGSGGTVQAQGCTISDNSAHEGGVGGGIYMNGGTLHAQDCIINGNTAYGWSGHGGGIYVNGGTLHAQDCIINGNTAYTRGLGSGGYGGGIFVASGGTVHAQGCTISDNSAHEGGVSSSAGFDLIQLPL